MFAAPLLVSSAFFIALSAAHAAIFTAQGSMAGEVTATSGLLQTRLTSIPGPALDGNGDVPGSAGVACFEYDTKPDFSQARRTAWTDAVADHDFIVRAALSGLQPGQLYYYRPIFGADQTRTSTGATCQFATLPGNASDRAVTFIVGSCMNYMKFMHGDQDAVVPLNQSQLLHDALQEAGIESRLTVVPGKGHEPLGDEPLAQVHAFFDRHLRPSQS
jgi:alkaline phosphatase/alkaline phosphatase D